MEDIAGIFDLFDGRRQLQLFFSYEPSVPTTGKAMEAERCRRLLGPQGAA